MPPPPQALLTYSPPSLPNLPHSPMLASPTAPAISTEDFLETVAANRGEVLMTAGRSASFRLEMSGNGVTFTPVRSGLPRPLNNVDAQRYLNVFNRTRSLKTSDYMQNMHNASYVLAIIRLWLG